MDSVTVTRWWWVRHAPVENAHLARLSGQADVCADLSDQQSFQALAPILPLNAIWIVSNLKRTRQTAKALWDAGAQRVGPVVEPAFAEQAFGDWTNLTWDEIASGDEIENGNEALTFWDDPAHTRPPGQPSESFVELCERVVPCINRMTYENLGRDVVSVAHAGTIRAAVGLALALTPDQALAVDVKNTALTRLDFISYGPKLKGDGNWRMVSLNQFGTSHTITGYNVTGHNVTGGTSS